MSPDPTLEPKSILGSNQGSRGVSAKLILALSSTNKKANKLPELVREVYLTKEREGRTLLSD